MSLRPHVAPSLFRSLLAGFACVLVLGLGLLAQSPTAHAWLHSADSACATGMPHSHPDSSDRSGALAGDHACAITAFAQGAHAFTPAIIVAAPLSVSVVAPQPETEIRLSRSEHLLPPGRAPPAA